MPTFGGYLSRVGGLKFHSGLREPFHSRSRSPAARLIASFTVAES